MSYLDIVRKLAASENSSITEESSSKIILSHEISALSSQQQKKSQQQKTTRQKPLKNDDDDAADDVAPKQQVDPVETKIDLIRGKERRDNVRDFHPKDGRERKVKRSGSERFRPNIGNATKLKGCTFCHPEMHTRFYRLNEPKEEVRRAVETVVKGRVSAFSV
jgi:hypothetical protein